MTGGERSPSSNTDPVPRETESLPRALENAYARSVMEVARHLGVDLKAGLLPPDAAARLQRFGPNLIQGRKKVSGWAILFRQLASSVVALLAAAMLLSVFFDELRQAGAILVVLAINTAIGFWTERRAVRSMESLRQLGSHAARVRRDRRVELVPAHELVPGDVVLFEAGDIVPADLRLSDAAGLAANESALTGESVPVEKSCDPVPAEAPLPDRGSMLFKGTAVVRGTGEGIVTGTGLSTEIGRIAQLVEQAEDQASPLERQLATLSAQLVWLTLGLAALITAVGLLSGRPVLLMIETAIALAVAAIPEGLPIVATLALARGMLRMARRNALVENLAAVETLGATTLILTDKTGTLTENRMEVERIATEAGVVLVDHQKGILLRDGEPAQAEADPALAQTLLVGVLCGNADFDRNTGKGSGDPMEVALLRVGALAGLSRQEQLRLFPEVEERPFDSRTKRMATLHSMGSLSFTAVKGAPEAVVPCCSRSGPPASRTLMEPERAAWLRRAEELAADGLRVLAIASRTDSGANVSGGGDLTFLGLVAFRDPPRQDIKGAISELRRAGIRVVMATGDHPSTALNIARAVGLVEDERQAGSSAVVTGAALSSLEQDGPGAVTSRDVFARVTPEQKLQLIGLFQRQAEVVAMIGDGINDAPALKKADIGVAMGLRGTQVAREAADMVLLDDAFPTIVHAVREGRIIFENIRRFSMYLLSCNLAEVLVVGLAVFFGLPLPLLPLQILFLNLVTDVFPAFALAMGKGDPDVLGRPPRLSGERILGRPQWRAIAIHGATIAAATLAALVLARGPLRLSPEEATTTAFLTIALAQLWHVFNIRSSKTTMIRNEVVASRYIWCALLLCLALILAAVYVPALAAALQLAPLGATGWLLVLSCSIIPLLAGQLQLALRHAGPKNGGSGPGPRAAAQLQGR